MADRTHVERLGSTVPEWNRWRDENPDLRPDVSSARLSRMDLRGLDLNRCNFTDSHLNGAKLDGANLFRANLGSASLQGASLIRGNLTEANLAGANLANIVLTEADLSYADLSAVHAPGAQLGFAVLAGADLSRANLYESDLHGANLKASKSAWANLTRVDFKGAVLRQSNLTGVSLIDADLSGADLRRANLSYARLIDSKLNGADLSECRVYGISAWNLQMTGVKEADLVITPPDEPAITVDHLEVAQFVYLLLNSATIRQAINTLTSKVVLILGRFTPERMRILQALRDALRNRGYLPVLFDFSVPSSRDLTETISTLAHLSKFVIADITDARSIPQELMAIVPSLPSVPVQPLLWAEAQEYGMFEHFRRYPWVLTTVIYADEESLLRSLDEKVITPAERSLIQ